MPADPVQRRLAAILAADVAGYSRLMGEAKKARDAYGPRPRHAHVDVFRFPLEED